MANIVTRSLTATTVTTTNLGKGTSLTHNELDSNFLNLNNDKIDNTDPNIFGNISLSGTSSSTVGSIVFNEATDNGVHNISIKSPTSLAANVSFTLPSDDGNANEVLITDGNGNLSWSATYAGDITEVTTTSPITGGGASGSINISFDPSAVRIDELANATANISLANGNYIFNGDGDEGIGFFADKLQLSNVELAGNMTLAGAYDIGTTGQRVDNLYVNNLDASGTISNIEINDLSDVDTTGVTTGSVLRYDGANWAVSNLIEETTEVSEDTTPQLGGDLDVNGNNIVSVSAGNVVIAPDSANSEGYSTATLDSGSGHFFLKSGLVLDHPGTPGLDAQYSNYITVNTTDGDLNMSANGGGRIRPRSDFQIRGSDGCDLWLRSEFSTDAKISYRGGSTEQGALINDRNNSLIKYYTDTWDQKMESTSGQVILQADSDEIQLNSSGSNVRATAQDIILQANDDIDFRATDRFQFRNKDSGTSEYNETMTLFQNNSGITGTTATGAVIESSSGKQSGDYDTSLVIRRYDEGDGGSTAHSGVEQRIASYDLTLESGKSTLSLNYVDDDNTGAQQNTTTLLKFKNSTSETATAGTQNAPDEVEFLQAVTMQNSGGLRVGGSGFIDTARLYRNTTSHYNYSLEVASNSEATAITAGQVGGAFGFTHKSDGFGDYYVGSINGVVGDEGTFGSAGENNNAIRLYTYIDQDGYLLNNVGEFRYASASFMKETLTFDRTSGQLTIAATTADDDLAFNIKDTTGTTQQAANFTMATRIEEDPDASGTTTTVYEPIMDLPQGIRIGTTAAGFSTTGNAADNSTSNWATTGIVITNADRATWPQLDVISYGGNNPLLDGLGSGWNGGLATHYPNGAFNLKAANGTEGSESAILTGDNLGGFNWTGHDGSGMGGSGNRASVVLKAEANEDFSSTNDRGCKLVLEMMRTGQVSATNTRKDILDIDDTEAKIGNVSDNKYINVNSDSQELLLYDLRLDLGQQGRIRADTDVDIRLDPQGTGIVRMDTAVRLDNQGSDPSGVTDASHIYAKDDAGSSEVYVRDEAGNVTKISPHNEAGEWEYFSRNTKTGKTVRVNMEEMIRDIEQLTGKTYIRNE